MAVLVRVTRADDRFTLHVGDVIEVVSYWLDPQEKWTVIRRVPDGHNPMCNIYKEHTERIPRADWGKYLPESEPTP